jgi:cysteine-rich repeat protein
VPDTDGDSDGTVDCLDACPTDPAKTTPGVCGCGTSDADTDGDGAPTCLDACPADPSKTDPGTCGCGFSDGDADGDGAVDCLDACPADAAKTDPGTCGCGSADVDVDPGPAFVCPGCGNGFLEAGEACDGGDLFSGDGCSSTCEVEPLSLSAPVPGTAGVVNAWSLTGTRPGATITMLASLRAGTTAVPLCPGLTVPMRDVVIIGTTIGGDDGTASFTLTPPTTIAGLVVRFVAVDQALCEASPLAADTL